METLILNLSEHLATDLSVNKYADVVPVFKKVNGIEKSIRKLFFLVKNPFIWFGDWKNNIKRYQTIIVFDGEYMLDIVKYISKKVISSQKIVVWYWNPVFLHLKYFRPNDFLKYTEEIWSFDPLDCERYTLKLNSTFYKPDIILPRLNVEFDTYFIGKNKNRRNLLLMLNDEFKKQDISSKMILIDDAKNQKVKQPLISYGENLINISKSKAIIEILQTGQTGNSLRALEAIFLKRKLITNNKNIVTERFYNCENIFIIGIDNLVKLKKFVNDPFVEYSKSVIEYYSIMNWLKRFQEGNI